MPHYSCESDSDSGSDLLDHFTHKELQTMKGSGIIDTVRDFLFDKLPHVVAIKSIMKGLTSRPSVPTKVAYGRPRGKRVVSQETLENLRRGREKRAANLAKKKSSGRY